MLSFSLLLLPRLGLWNRDKAAKRIAEVAIVVAGRIDAATAEVEVVGAASSRAGSRGPISTVLASVAKSIGLARLNPSAPYKEERKSKISNLVGFLVQLCFN